MIELGLHVPAPADSAFVALVEAELAIAGRNVAMMERSRNRAPVPPMSSMPGPARRGTHLWHIRRMARIATAKP